MKPMSIFMTVFAAVIAAVMAATVGVAVAAQSDTIPPNPACAIKGNINDKGEHIYHVPGDPWYAKTRLDISKGERWFCSEAQAQAAGWRSPKK